MTLHTHPARFMLKFASLAFTFPTPDTHPNKDLQHKWLIIGEKGGSFIWKHPYVFNPVKLLACSYLADV